MVLINLHQPEFQSYDTRKFTFLRSSTQVIT